MRKPCPQKSTRCFAKRFSGEQRDLRAVSARLRMEVKLPKIGGKISEVGYAERTPSASVPAGFSGRRERSERRHGKRADLYIGVRSALIYQKSGDFRVKINKGKLCGIAYSYTKRFLPFFRKKACAEKRKFEENKKCYR